MGGQWAGKLPNKARQQQLNDVEKRFTALEDGDAVASTTSREVITRQSHSHLRKRQGSTIPPNHHDNIELEPLPKQFARILKRSEKKDTQNQVRRAEAAKTNDKRLLSRNKLNNAKRPNETIVEYGRRLDDEIRHSVNQAARSETKTFAKRKARLEERKKKRVERRKRNKNSSDTDNDDAHKPAFGEQANAPPLLTVVPKKVGGGAGARRVAEAALIASTLSTSSSSAPTSNTTTDGTKRTRLRDLPLIQQKLRGEQRALAIEAYRNIKKNQQQQQQQHH